MPTRWNSSRACSRRSSRSFKLMHMINGKKSQTPGVDLASASIVSEDPLADFGLGEGEAVHFQLLADGGGELCARRFDGVALELFQGDERRLRHPAGELER